MSLARTTFALPAGEFHALVGGDRDAPPLLFLHGFPDHPPTATAFLARLARDHRVVAPWLRGYAPSPCVGPFDLETLVADTIALIDQLGGRVALVGHDWGAMLTYAVCTETPDRIARAATLGMPHPLAFLRALRGVAQLRRSWYMGLFQLPGAERIVVRGDLALIDRLWRTWSPGLVLDGDRRAELHACLRASMPAPLGYYRALIRPPWRLRSILRAASRKISPPLLQLHGADDGCIAPIEVDDDHRFAVRVREVLPGLGHFLHLEAPGELARRIGAWLQAS